MSGGFEGGSFGIKLIAEQRARMYEEMKHPVAWQDRLINFAIAPTVFADTYHADSQSDFTRMAENYRQVVQLFEQHQFKLAGEKFIALERSPEAEQLQESYESARQTGFGLHLGIGLASLWAAGGAAGWLGLLGEGGNLTLGSLSSARGIAALSVMSTTAVTTRRGLEELITGEERLYDRQASLGKNTFLFAEDVALTAGLFLFLGAASQYSQTYLNPTLAKVASPNLAALGMSSGLFAAELSAFTTWEILETNYQGIKSPQWDPRTQTGQCLTAQAWSERILFLLAFKGGMKIGNSLHTSWLAGNSRGTLPGLQTIMPELTPVYAGPTIPADYAKPPGSPTIIRPMQMAMKDNNGGRPKSPKSPPNERPAIRAEDITNTDPIPAHLDQRKTEPLIASISKPDSRIPLNAKTESDPELPREIPTETDLLYMEGPLPSLLPTKTGPLETDGATAPNQRLINTMQIDRKSGVPADLKRTEPHLLESPTQETSPNSPILKKQKFPRGGKVVRSKENPHQATQVMVTPVLDEAQTPKSNPVDGGMADTFKPNRPIIEKGDLQREPETIRPPITPPPPSPGLLGRAKGWFSRLFSRSSTIPVLPIDSDLQWSRNLTDKIVRIKIPGEASEFSVSKSDFSSDTTLSIELNKLPNGLFKILRIQGRPGKPDIFILEVENNGATLYINDFPVTPGNRHMLEPGDIIRYSIGPTFQIVDPH